MVQATANALAILTVLCVSVGAHADFARDTESKLVGRFQNTAHHAITGFSTSLLASSNSSSLIQDRNACNTSDRVLLLAQESDQSGSSKGAGESDNDSDSGGDDESGTNGGTPDMSLEPSTSTGDIRM